MTTNVVPFPTRSAAAHIDARAQLAWFYADASQAVSADPDAAIWLAGELAKLKALLEARLGRTLSD